MEEGSDGARQRIDSRDVRAFGAIAIDAGEGEIFEPIFPMMFQSDDVINLEGDT